MIPICSIPSFLFFSPPWDKHVLSKKNILFCYRNFKGEDKIGHGWRRCGMNPIIKCIKLTPESVIRYESVERATQVRDRDVTSALVGLADDCVAWPISR